MSWKFNQTLIEKDCKHNKQKHLGGTFDIHSSEWSRVKRQPNKSRV